MSNMWGSEEGGPGGPGGPSSFATITGDPSDNANLAAFVDNKISAAIDGLPEPIAVDQTARAAAAQALAVANGKTTMAAVNVAIAAAVQELLASYVTPLQQALAAAVVRIAALEEGGTPPVEIPLTDAGARRLVDQSGFGVRETDVASVMALGYSGYLDAQFQNTLTDPNVPDRVNGDSTPTYSHAAEWLHFNAVNGNGQVKARWIHALQNFYVLNINVGSYARDGHAWASIFNDHAFGNARDLMFTISTSYMMAKWLTFYGNPKAAGGKKPDENYARELLQLFGVGLVRLRNDGSVILTGQLNPSDPKYVSGGIAPAETYTQTDIEQLARVFTGMGPAHSFFGGEPTLHWYDMVQPTEGIEVGYWPEYHEMGTKSFLGVTIPENTGPKESVGIAVDTVFNHPSHPPFFCKQMIQAMVCSNPSPAYVGRVVAKYIDNGSGVRGDMKATIKAILLDAEARDPSVATGDNWGRVRDGWVARLGNLRTFVNLPLTAPIELAGGNGRLTAHAQAWDQPSVFGYHKIDHTSSSDVRALGLVDPEMEPMTENGILRQFNGNMEAGLLTYFSNQGNNPRFDFARFDALRANPAALVDEVCKAFCVDISTGRKQTLIDFLTTQIGVDEGGQYVEYAKARSTYAVAAVLASPERMHQK